MPPHACDGSYECPGCPPDVTRNTAGNPYMCRMCGLASQYECKDCGNVVRRRDHLDYGDDATHEITLENQSRMMPCGVCGGDTKPTSLTVCTVCEQPYPIQAENDTSICLDRTCIMGVLRRVSHERYVMWSDPTYDAEGRIREIGDPTGVADDEDDISEESDKNDEERQLPITAVNGRPLNYHLPGYSAYARINLARAEDHWGKRVDRKHQRRERATQRGMPLPAEFLGPDGNDDGDGFRPYNEPGDGVPGARQRQRIRLPGEISIPAVVQEDVDMGPLAPGGPLPEGMMP